MTRCTMLLAALPLRTQPARGSDGIADKYPQEKGTENDPAVVFAESFDAPSVDAIAGRWESAQNMEIMSLSSHVPEATAGGKSPLMTHVGGESTGAYLYRRLEPGYQKQHVRFYVKLDRDCAPIHHFFHVGGYNPATPWPQGGAGQRPRGDERFSTGVEPFGDSRRWDYYTYSTLDPGPGRPGSR
jgi:hypothetical protein